MADLFALGCIHKDLLFRNDDAISPGKAKAIQRLMEGLCSDLRGVAGEILYFHPETSWHLLPAIVAFLFLCVGVRCQDVLIAYQVSTSLPS